MNKPLLFVVPKSAAMLECVACHALHPAMQLEQCVCGSPICKCGNECPDCIELFEVYQANLTNYRAKHLHLLGEMNPRHLKWHLADQEKIMKAFDQLGWLN